MRGLCTARRKKLRKAKPGSEAKLSARYQGGFVLSLDFCVLQNVLLVSCQYVNMIAKQPIKGARLCLHAAT